MNVTIRGESDEVIDRMTYAFTKYTHQHPEAQIEIRRQNSVTIYIRVIDPDFTAINRGERHEILWQFLEPLSDDDQSQVSLLLALTPAETKNSFANLEFDHPVPSGL